MTTQEIIEKIRAEVERMKVDYLNRSYTFVPKAMQDLLDFLSDLEKECEEFPTTDEEMKQFLATHPKAELPEKYKTPDWMFEESEKPIDIDFEQELYKHFGQVKDFTLGMRIGQYFYNLCKDQMLKEAVEGEVVSTSDNGWECIRIYKKLHKCDDKVKLIIVKED